MKTISFCLLALITLACKATESQTGAATSKTGSSATASASTETVRYTVTAAGLSIDDTEELAAELENTFSRSKGITSVASRTEAGRINFTIKLSADDEDMLCSKIESAIRSRAPRATSSKQ